MNPKLILLVAVAASCTATTNAGPCQDLRAQYNRQIKKLEKNFRCQRKELREEYECNREKLKKELRRAKRHAECHRDESVHLIRAQLEQLEQEFECAENELEKGFRCSRMDIVQQREIAIRECRQTKHGRHIPVHTHEVLPPAKPTQVHPHFQNVPPEPRPHHGARYDRRSRSINVGWQDILITLLARS